MIIKCDVRSYRYTNKLFINDTSFRFFFHLVAAFGESTKPRIIYFSLFYLHKRRIYKVIQYTLSFHSPKLHTPFILFLVFRIVSLLLLFLIVTFVTHVFENIQEYY